MRVPVKGIQPGEYAEMIRTENEWTIQIGDSVVSVIPNKPPFSTLGRSQYKLLGLEMITKVKERQYKKGLRKRIRLYCNFLSMKAILMEAGSIMATFSRALPKNLLELAQIVANLKDNVSAKTLLKLLPFVEDPDYEIEEVTKQKAEEVKRQQELFGMGANEPPEFGEEEEPEEEETDPDGEAEEEPKEEAEEEKEKQQAAGSKG